jgi:hypothetical protein
MQKTRNVWFQRYDSSQKVQGICAGVVNARQDRQIAGKCSTRIFFVALVAFYGPFSICITSLHTVDNLRYYLIQFPEKLFIHLIVMVKRHYY